MAPVICFYLTEDDLHTIEGDIGGVPDPNFDIYPLIKCGYDWPRQLAAMNNSICWVLLNQHPVLYLPRYLMIMLFDYWL